MSDASAYVKRLRPGNASAKLVLFALAEYCDEQGTAQPSSKRLAEDTDLSPRTISTALDLLEDKGMITRVRCYGDMRRVPDAITIVGFAEWRDSLDAEFASKAKRQVQMLHVQKLQVKEIHQQDLHVSSQDVVALRPQTTNSFDAKFARAKDDIVRDITTTIRDSTNQTLLSEQPPPKAKTAKLSNPSPTFLALWGLWMQHDCIRRSRRKPAWEAYQRMIRMGAHAAEIEAGMRAFLADDEKTKQGGQFMPALAIWLKDEVWRDWVKDAALPKIDWQKRLAYFREKGDWVSRWGPAPGEEGYAGPPL